MWLHSAALAAEPTPQQIEFFEKRVRPVLVNRCFDCHSDESAESELRLDSLAGMLKGGVRGAAITPGDAKRSLLISAVNHADRLHMPPEEKLPQNEIADLARWVEMGAPWPGAMPPVKRDEPGADGPLFTDEDRSFWAFQPVERPPPPKVNNAQWVQSPVDAFILARLEAAGIDPAPPADRRTLIRRMSLDLIGLPPTPAEVEAFLADDSPGAIERLIDRLLASPRYGERWGRHWLDVARYADSNGLDENLAYAHAFRYRDYVIGAFNRDKPFDRFVQEQLAGDLLPIDDPHQQLDALVATGFLSLGAKMLAEDDPVKMQMDIVDEQLDTIGRAFMGLTLGCARCHAHKFDPIPIEDYYSLAGILKSTKTMENFKVVARWQERELALPQQIERRDAHRKQIDGKKAEIAEAAQSANEQLLSEARKHVGLYLLHAERQRRLDQLQKNARSFGAHPPAEAVAGLQIIEAEDYARGNCLKDATNYGKGIGVILNEGQLPNVAEYDLEIAAEGPHQVELRYAAAGARPVKLIINGRLVKSDAASQVTGSWHPDTQQWAVEGFYPLAAGRNTIRLERDGPFPHFDKLLVAPISSGDGAAELPNIAAPADGYQPVGEIVRQWVKYLEESEGESQAVFALWREYAANGAVSAQSGGELAEVLLADGPPTSLAELADRYQALFDQALFVRADQAPPAEKLNALRKLLNDPAGPFAIPKKPEEHYATETRQRLASLGSEVDALEKSLPKLPLAMAVSDGAAENLRVHLRGNHVTLGEETPRRFLRVIAGEEQAPIDDSRSGRLELARWLTHPEHPLTGRVIANRLWLWHFGEGLVRSPDNFGRLGGRPTHPLLLDWLADRLVSQGWSIKAMHRELLLSSTYQMSTAYNEQAAGVDPKNELWWRRERLRFEAEAIRDALLAVSGELDSRMGGTLLHVENRKYVTSTANVDPVVYDTRRRSVYLPVVRSALYDVFQAFDFPDPSVLNGRRVSTTVAPQALFMMNSRFVAERTASLARSLLSDDAVDDAGRVRELYLRALNRLPAPDETRRALDYIERYASAAEEAGQPAQQRRLSAWSSLCRTMVASSEFLYVE